MVYWESNLIWNKKATYKPKILTVVAYKEKSMNKYEVILFWIFLS